MGRRRGGDMRLTWRDWVATLCVAAAALMYAVWLSDGEVFGISGTRALGVAVLLLGLAASVTAVVFGVGEGLLQTSRLYLAVTSLIGLAALVAGIVVLVNESEAMLATLVSCTVGLWLISTVRHAMGEQRGEVTRGFKGAPAG
jgi:hypothetical protein